MRIHSLRSLACLSLFSLVAVSSARTVHADAVSGTRFALQERAHTIAMRVDRGFATLVVERVVENVGPNADQAFFHIDVPETSVATRLRSKGDGNQWFEGELMDAEEAAKKYTELTGFGGAYPKDPALLSWRSQGHLRLQVFPVSAKSTKTVEYTLTMPLTYEGGMYTATLPALGTATTPASIRFQSARAEDEVRVNDVPISASTRVTSKEGMRVQLVPRSSMRLEGSAVSVPLENGRSFFRAAFDVPPRLGEVPTDAAVAIVLDASRSMNENGGAVTALTAAQGYLSHFARASVTVIAFNRTVDLPFGTNIPAKEARARLASFTLPLQNGSQLDEALKRADDAVAAAPNAKKRIVVITDLRTRNALTPEKFAALGLRSGALLHVGVVGSHSGGLERDDDSAWATLPRRTGGLLWKMPTSADVAQARAEFEPWARPMRIDRVKVSGMPGSYAEQESFIEGSRLEHITIRTDAPHAVSLEGEIWSRPVRVAFPSSAAEDKRWSALAFGTDSMHLLTEPEQRILAMKGGAVSPVTSYLAIEPGVRPSTEGLTEGEGRGGGGTGSGMGFGNAGGLGGGGRGVESAQAIFARELAKIWERCVGHGSVSANIETTLDEVVELGVTVQPADRTTQACVVERLWAFEPPRESFADEHATFDATTQR